LCRIVQLQAGVAVVVDIDKLEAHTNHGILPWKLSINPGSSSKVCRVLR
jgi:hypothetical protein